MSEAPTVDLATPAPAPVVEGAAPAAAPAAQAAPAADATLDTPEAAQGVEAAASGQGGGEGEAAPAGGKSEDAPAEGVKPEGDKPATEAKDDAPQGAPEAYADFTMPEGFTLPAEFGAELTGIAKELNLPQAKAQQLIDLGIKHAQAVQTQIANSVQTAKAVWADEARNDVEIGGDKFAVNMGVAKKAMLAFGSPKLTGLLNQTGLSAHPEFLRLLVRVGEAISEDTLVDGGISAGGIPGQRDHAKRLYPNQK